MIEKENKWIKFYPSLELPKERVSIAYATHDERGYRFAYGYFQFYNGTCGCFWKDGNEQPKVVKAEDIKYWMPVPSLDVQEEPKFKVGDLIRKDIIQDVIADMDDTRYYLEKTCLAIPISQQDLWELVEESNNVLCWNDMSEKEKSNFLYDLSHQKEEPTTSIWHDASEKPEYKEIIALSKDNDYVEYGIYDDALGFIKHRGYKVCSLDCITKWAYVEDLKKL